MDVQDSYGSFKQRQYLSFFHFSTRYYVTSLSILLLVMITYWAWHGVGGCCDDDFVFWIYTSSSLLFDLLFLKGLNCLPSIRSLQRMSVFMGF